MAIYAYFSQQSKKFIFLLLDSAFEQIFQQWSSEHLTVYVLFLNWYIFRKIRSPKIQKLKTEQENLFKY